jgi:tetratricopeptide (TPR) repeat protein
MAIHRAPNDDHASPAAQAQRRYLVRQASRVVEQRVGRPIDAAKRIIGVAENAPSQRSYALGDQSGVRPEDQDGFDLISGTPRKSVGLSVRDLHDVFPPGPVPAVHYTDRPIRNASTAPVRSIWLILVVLAGLFADRGAAAQVPWAIHVDECYTAADSDRGVQLCARALVSMAIPDSMRADIYVQRAHHLTELGRFDAALADFSSAIQYDPGHSGAYLGRAIARRAQHDYPGALADLDRARTLQPRSALVLLHRAATRELALDPAAARADYGGALALEPGLAAAIEGLARTARARGLVDVALSEIATLADAKSSAKVLHERGLTHLARNDLSAADADFAAVLALEPDHAEALANRGLVHHRREQFDEAMRRYDEAIARQPTLAVAYFNRALIWRRRGDPGRALLDWRRARELASHLATPANVAYFEDGTG